MLAIMLVLATAGIAQADTPNPSGTVTGTASGSTLTVSGTWTWPGHNKCDKFAGWAVDWNDPSAPGNAVGSVDVGTASDNAVHYDSTQCGPSGTWGPLSHTYPASVSRVTVCVVTYDVHSGDVGKSGGHGTVAGGPSRNDDNSMDENGVCLASPTFTINDRDNDTIPDDDDNCPDTPNTNQSNVDGDAFGDLCDTEGPLGNTNGKVTTGNPTGDDCKDGVDNDGDGKTDGAEATCVSDRDNDTIPDDDDNCPDIPNTDQKNVDNDALGDVCDTEGPPGNTNGIKTPANPTGDDCKDAVDNDGDGNTDLLDGGCTGDRDDDGIPDDDDNCPDTPNTDQSNVDGDAKGDLCDSEGPPGNTNGLKTTGNPTGDDCKDNVDNDGDGKTDGVDTGCQSGPVGPTGQSGAGTPCISPTLVGGAGDSLLIGTPGNDIILDLLGNNHVEGRGGNDTICTGPGNDVVLSLNGSDIVWDQGGVNLIRTAAGADTITVHRGISRIASGKGRDKVNATAGTGRNNIRLGRGRDGAVAGSGKDLIKGGAGRDRIVGGDGNNRLGGGRGNDKLRAGSGRDRMSGGKGKDTCRADGGRNRFRRCEIRRGNGA